MYADGYKPVILSYFTGGTFLLISDPTVVEAMYTSKNKYFDKHPLIKNSALCFTGNSILLRETSKEWKKARQTLSPAFYKGKLLSLFELARNSIRVTVNRLNGMIE